MVILRGSIIITGSFIVIYFCMKCYQTFPFCDKNVQFFDLEEVKIEFTFVNFIISRIITIFLFIFILVFLDFICKDDNNLLKLITSYILNKSYIGQHTLNFTLFNELYDCPYCLNEIKV